MMTSPTLEVRRLSLFRGRRRIYADLNLVLRRGVTTLLGPNGAGKTTLLNALLRPDRIRDGEVLLNGERITDGVSLKNYHSQLGHMPQDWRFFSGFSALESVEYVAWLKGLAPAAVPTAARAALSRVQLLDRAAMPVRSMSGGMRQRVGLAEALVNRPAIVLLDEPTVGLDPAQRASFRDALASEAKERAVLLSTHLTDDVRAIADRVLIVDRGAIVFDGTPTEMADLGGGKPTDASALEAGYLVAVSAAPAIHVR